MKSGSMNDPLRYYIDVFLSISIIWLVIMKFISFIFIKSVSRIWNSALLMLFLASASCVLFTARAPNMAFGDVPAFHFPLGLCTIFPATIEIITLLHILSTERILKLSCLVYIGLSALTKTLFSLSLPLLHSWLYRLVMILLALDYLFLAVVYYNISRRAGSSQVVLNRRIIDFSGITLCASTFFVLGMIYPSVWATLVEVLVILVTGLICLAQPLIFKSSNACMHGQQRTDGLNDEIDRPFRRLEDC